MTRAAPCLVQVRLWHNTTGTSKPTWLTTDMSIDTTGLSFPNDEDDDEDEGETENKNNEDAAERDDGHTFLAWSAVTTFYASPAWNLAGNRMKKHMILITNDATWTIDLHICRNPDAVRKRLEDNFAGRSVPQTDISESQTPSAPHRMQPAQHRPRQQPAHTEGQPAHAAGGRC